MASLEVNAVGVGFAGKRTSCPSLDNVLSLSRLNAQLLFMMIGRALKEVEPRKHLPVSKSGLNISNLNVSKSEPAEGVIL